MSKHLQKVEWATTDGGRQYACLTIADAPVWVPASLVLGPPGKLIAGLGRYGVYPTQQWERERIVEVVAAARPYAGAPPIDQPGFTGTHFAFSDGSILSPADTVPGPYLGEVVTPARLLGSSNEWQGEVAERLREQAFLRTMVCLTLAAPLVALGLLSEPLIIEAVLPNSSAESTLMALLRSALGQLSPPGGCLSFSEVLERSARVNDSFADLLHPVRNADLSMVGASAAARTAQITKFLSTVGDRSRPQSYLVIGTRPLSDLVGADSEVAALLAARTIKIAIGQDRPFGVFDKYPEGEKAITAFAQSLESAANQHRGHLLHSFMLRLVHERARDEAGLRAAIDKRIALFKRRERIDPHDDRLRHATDAFGLIYAAGWLAAEWELLPARDIGGGVARIFRTLWTAPPKRLSFDDQLRALARDPKTVHLGYRQAEPKQSAIESADVLVRHRKTHCALMIRVGAIRRFLPNWHARVGTPEVQARLVREKKRIQTKRRLVPNGPQELVYSFALPEGE